MAQAPVQNIEAEALAAVTLSQWAAWREAGGLDVLTAARRLLEDIENGAIPLAEREVRREAMH